MVRLGVNVDHVATVRQARRSREPDPVTAALICEQAGADSIVAHLREDRRHIQERDIELLKAELKTHLNLEMSIYPEIVDVACRIKPLQATLVPERRQELTTEGGLDVLGQGKRVAAVIKRLKKEVIKVSLFIDPDKKQVKASRELDADIIELHTGRYAEAKTEVEAAACLEEIRESSDYAQELGLRVSAGHGLDYRNVRAITRIEGIEELNIGYSIICRAVFVGLSEAVREMIKIIKELP
jgi:pyridoxine 5-phosphate synthase